MPLHISDISFQRLNVFGSQPVRRVGIPTHEEPQVRVPSQFPVRQNTLSRVLSKFSFQDYVTSLICFAPSSKAFPTPKDRGIPNEEVLIHTPDGETLHGYFLPAKEKIDKAMLYLHGNDSNVDLWHLASKNIQDEVPVNSLIVDYRGYGKSTGKPTPDGIITDVLSMYDHLLQRGYKPENISVYGRSLGGAIALELASRVLVRSVVVQSSFFSLRDLKAVHLPHLPSFLIRGDFLNSKELIKDIYVPILISHGTKDNKVPIEHAYQLFEVANEPKTMISLDGAGHEHLKDYYTQEYFNILREMFL